jgi:PhnB protein
MTIKPIPDGYHTLTPYLIVADAERQIDFIRRAFGAREHEVLRHEDGSVMHADLLIGDSHVMIGQAKGAWKPMQASIYTYVPDCDASYRSALAAGGTSLMEPADQFYGDRHGGVLDPAGNQWWMATHIENVSSEELRRRAAAYRAKQAAV